MDRRQLTARRLGRSVSVVAVGVLLAGCWNNFPGPTIPEATTADLQITATTTPDTVSRNSANGLTSHTILRVVVRNLADHDVGVRLQPDDRHFGLAFQFVDGGGNLLGYLAPDTAVPGWATLSPSDSVVAQLSLNVSDFAEFQPGDYTIAGVTDAATSPNVKLTVLP